MCKLTLFQVELKGRPTNASHGNHNRTMACSEITTFGYGGKSRLISVVDGLDSNVGDLQHPTAVDDTVGRLEVTVNFDRTCMQISHSLQNVAMTQLLYFIVHSGVRRLRVHVRSRCILVFCFMSVDGRIFPCCLCCLLYPLSLFCYILLTSHEPDMKLSVLH